MDSGSSSRKNDRNQRMWARFYKRRPHENLAYYQEEKSIGTHSEEDGDGLLTMDSPPMYPNDSFSVVSVYRDEESTASGHMI